jgi:predicted enzyme related to lactoylglutathione lyase
MTEATFGTIGWHDLTVPNAAEVKDFYVAVLGATVQETSMGEYGEFAVIQDPAGAFMALCQTK